MGTSYWKASGLPLTQQRLKTLLSYDKDTGLFTWLVSRPGRKAKHDLGAGEAAYGNHPRTISVDGVIYSTGQLAWLYVHGEWPEGDIYHANRVGGDDRINNLIDSGVLHRTPVPSGRIEAARLRELTVYDPETGVFSWRLRSGRTGGASKEGTPLSAVFNANGYLRIGVDRRKYMAHRLAWLYMTGEWPPANLVVDHINGERDDNKWANLRLATRSQNRVNSPGWATRVGPHKGVYPRNDGRWDAKITISLGVFDSADDARDAFTAASKRLYGEFAWSPT